MSLLAFRKDRVDRVVAGKYAPSQSTVTAYRAGAVVNGGQTSNTLTVRRAHRFPASGGVKLIVMRYSGGEWSMVSGSYRTVTSATDTTVVFSGSTLTVLDNDYLVNLGNDTGIGTPLFDASPVALYREPEGVSTPISTSSITPDTKGDFWYFTREGPLWELVRNGVSPQALCLDTVQAFVPTLVLDVRSFGALGDGVSDDTIAIQAALTAVPSTGAKVYAPAGVYLVSAAVWIKSNTHLYGDGIDATVFKRKANSLSATVNPNRNRNPVVTAGSAPDVPYTNGSPGASIAVTDLTIDGNYLNQTLSATDNGAHGFNIPQTIGSDSGGCIDGLRLTRVKAQNTLQDGISIRNCRNVTIANCTTFKTGQSSAVTTKNGISLTGGPTELANGWCTGLIVVNNHVSYSGDATTRGAEGIAVTVGDDVVIHGNNISHVDFGIEGTYTTSGAYTNYNWSIVGNTIHDLNDADTSPKLGISLARSASQPLHGCSITGNTIYNVTHNAILTQNVNDLSIGLNTIHKVNLTTNATYFTGIDIQSCAEAVCVENTIHHVSPANATLGIRFFTVTGGLLSQNTILNDNASATGANLFLTQTTVNCLVSDNRLIGNKYGVQIGVTSSGNVTKDNLITGTLTATYLDGSALTNYDFGSVDAGGLRIPGVLTLVGGIAGGIPRNVGTWNINAATDGNDNACTNGTAYCGSIWIPSNMTITGINFLVGSVGGTNSVIVSLHASDGTLLANSAAAGTLVGTAAQLQQVPFTTPYAAKGPFIYYIALTFNGTTAKFRTIPAQCSAGSGIVGGTSAQTFGNPANITAPVTFSANAIPVASLY